MPDRDVDSVICASPAYLSAHGAPTSAGDLSAHNCLTYANYGRSLWHFRCGEETVSVPVSGNFTTNDASIVARAALAGTGVAMLPHFVANAAIKAGNLVRLLPEAKVETLGVFAAYLSRQHMSGALRALIDYLALNLTVLNEDRSAP